MRIKIKDEATNPGNIGGYKNTPYTGKRPVWNPNHKREPGSHRAWHDKDYVREGFLSDLVDLATTNDSSEDSDRQIAQSTFNDAIKPHTADDLYKAVCFMLSDRVSNETVRKAASLFLPTKKGWVTAPSGIDKEVFDKYKSKVEDAVIEYCTTDALDILQRIRNQYGNKKEITGDMNYGTILSKVDSDDYDLMSKIEQIYKEFEESAGKPEESSSDTSPKPRNSYSMDNAIKEVQKSLPTADPELISRAIEELVTSEYGISVIKQILGGGR